MGIKKQTRSCRCPFFEYCVNCRNVRAIEKRDTIALIIQVSLIQELRDGLPVECVSDRCIQLLIEPSRDIISVTRCF